MSRQIDFEKPLSEDDKQYALDRGLIHEVTDNTNRFRQGDDSTSSNGNTTDTGTTYAVHNATGLNGNEPSATSDRTTVSGLGLAQGQLNVSPPVAGTESAETTPNVEPVTDLEDQGNSGLTAGGAEGKYEEWTVAELAEELGTRELSKSGNKAELVARLTADDADKESE